MDDRHVIRLIKASERIATAAERIAEALDTQVKLDADTRHMMDVVMQADVKQTEQADPNHVTPPEWMTR